MQITSDSTKELCGLRMHLRSVDMNFHCHFNPPLDPETGTFIFKHNNNAYIEFKDSHEIDQLINVLQRFRDESRQRMGYWK